MKLVCIVLFLQSAVGLSKSQPVGNTPYSIALTWNPSSTPVLLESLKSDNTSKWWAATCSELSKRILHGNAIMGIGPFEKATCSPLGEHATNEKFWNLNLKEQNEKLQIEISFQNLTKAQIYVKKHKINKDFLMSKEVLDLISYGLLDQLPFLGLVKRDAAIKERVFLQYKLPTVLLDFLPSNLIFYDLNPIRSTDALNSSVHLEEEVNQQENQYTIKNSRLLKILSKKNFIWFHNAQGIAQVSPKIQKKLLDTQDLAISAENAKQTKDIIVRNYFLVRLGKQLIQTDPIQQKAWLVGFQSEFGSEVFPGMQFSYDYSPKISNEGNTGSEDLQWQRLALGKSFVKRFENSAVDFTPRLRLFNYKGDLVTIEEGQELGVTNLDTQNCLSTVFEFGYEKTFKADWIRIFYSYGLTPMTNAKSRVSGHHAGMHYFHELGAAQQPKASRLLLNIFTEFEKLNFAKNSDLEEGAKIQLKATSFFSGIGLGLSW